MDKIKFISKTKEGWETDGEFNPLFLEVTEEETEYCFDIGKRNEINDLKSECIFLSKEDAKRLGKWLMKLDFPTQE